MIEDVLKGTESKANEDGEGKIPKLKSVESSACSGKLKER